MIKYKVVDPRITYIQDILACYSKKIVNGKDCGGVRQSLSATCGEYLNIQEYADYESFQKSLYSGALRTFLDAGLIVEEEVADQRVVRINEVIANNPFTKEPIKGVSEDVLNGTPLVAQKSVKEEVEQNKPAVDLNTLSIAGLSKLLKEVKKQDKERKTAAKKEQERKATEAEEPVSPNFPAIPKNIPTDDISQIDELNNWDREQEDAPKVQEVVKEDKTSTVTKAVIKKEPRFISAIPPKTFAEFGMLKYQEGLHAIAGMNDSALLTKIAQNAKQSLTKSRAIQRLDRIKIK